MLTTLKSVNSDLFLPEYAQFQGKFCIHLNFVKKFFKNFETLTKSVKVY